MKFIGGILAGGSGTRMANAGKPKQFISIGGIPVLIRTIRTFLTCNKLEHVFVAMNKEWIAYANNLLDNSDIERQRVTIIAGGSTRFESLIKLSKAVLNIVGGTDAILLNHDCARPFVALRILDECLDAVNNFDMVTTSIPAIDTVIISRNGKCSDTVPDRSTVFCDQGPQAFRVKEFLDIVSGLDSRSLDKYMEAGRMYLDHGKSVGIVAGDRSNFKLTTPFDIVLAEAMIKEGIVL